MNEIGWPEVEPALGFVELVRDQALAVETDRTHVVYTRGADGQAHMYINGKETVVGKVGGDLSAWDSQMHLALGNEFVGDRSWLGVYHHVAIYNHVLEPSEIKDHFSAGSPKHRDRLQIQYAFNENEGKVIQDISGQKPALNLHIQDTNAVRWLKNGLKIKEPVLIATKKPAERLTTAVQKSNAFTLEAWITPAKESQTGPARIVTLSRDHGSRNFTLGQDENHYEMRFRTTTTSANGLPSLQTDSENEASIAAMRSPNRDKAAIFVTQGSQLSVDKDQLKKGLKAEWFDPSNAEWRKATPNENGYFQPPSDENWVLIFK